MIGLASGGASAGITTTLLMFILKNLRTDVKNNSSRINQLYGHCEKKRNEMFNKIEDQEDCVESELKKIDDKLNRVITVMQMQAKDNPVMVEILKGGS